MEITKNQFDRVCKEFRNYAKEPITVSFSKGSFWISGTDNAISNLKKVYRNAEAAFIQNGFFILRTSFNGEYEN